MIRARGAGTIEGHFLFRKGPMYSHDNTMASDPTAEGVQTGTQSA